MLSPVLVCKYFQIMTITWFTDFQVHSVFAIFSVTDECVQWVRYMISFVCCFFFCFVFFFFFAFFVKTTHSHSPTERPFSDSFEFTSNKCVQASKYERKYSVIKVCADLSQLISDHAPYITISNLKTDQICQFLLL